MTETSWREIGQYTLSREWQLTDAVQSQFIRIRTLSPATFFSKAFICKTRTLNGTIEQGGIDNRWIAFYPNAEARVLDLGDTPPPFESAPLAFRRSLSRRHRISWRFAIDELLDYDPMRSKRTYDVQQDDLDGGLFTAVHNLQDDYVSVTVWDNTKRLVSPGEILSVDQNTVLIDFSNLEPISGTYKLIIFK